MASDAGESNVAARYASALYELADEKGALDTVAADLTALVAMVDASEDFRRFIRSPIISRTEQVKGIAAVGDTAQFSALTSQFLGLLAANRRLALLPAVVKSYRAILAAHRGEATAEVTSAAALSDSQVAALADSLRKTVGRKVDVVTKIDPSILGGLIVRVGSRMVDSSIRSKLQRLKLVLKGVG